MTQEQDLKLAIAALIALWVVDRLLGLPGGFFLALLLAVPIVWVAARLPSVALERILLVTAVLLLITYLDDHVLGGAIPHFALSLPSFLPPSLIELAACAALLATLSYVGYRARCYHAYSAEEASLRDGLTGLYNQRFFQQKLDQMLAPTQRRKTRVSLIWIDLDNFKLYNDTYGHDAGDDLLRAVANHLANPQAFRSTDFICRAGGDEFAIILPHTDEEEAQVVLKRLRMYLDKFLVGQGGAAMLDRPRFPGRSPVMPFKERARRVQLGFSLGVATSQPGIGMTGAELRRLADEKMYAEKELHHSRSLRG